MAKHVLTDPEYRVLADFRRTLRQFLAFSEAKAAEAGLTPQQHQALLAIRAAEPGRATVGYVAECLTLRPQSASGLVDRLVTLGMLERQVSPEDRRQAIVVLTAKAGDLLELLSITHQEELRRLRPMLADLLDRIGE